MYKTVVDEVCVGFTVYLDEDKATEKILSYCKKKFGNDLPKRAEEIIKKRVTENWKAGKLDANQKKDVWRVSDKKAVKFFRENDKFFLGSQYDKFSDDIKKVIDDELTGTARSHDKKVVKRLRKKMGDALDHPKIKGYYDGVIRNSVNRSRNYSRAFGFEEAGIKELEIVAILDDSTSDVCREMNGRRIEVKVAADFVREVIASPVNDFDAYVDTFPWPSSKDVKAMPGKTTGDIVAGLKCKLPPFHYKCRTTYIAGAPITYKKAGGGKFKGKLDIGDTAEAKTRAKELQAYSKDELLSKASSLQKSIYWGDELIDFDGTVQKSYDYHKKKHGHEFKDISYDAAFRKTKKNCDRVITYAHINSRGGNETIWIWHRQDIKGFLMTDDSGKVLRFNKQRAIPKWNNTEGVEIT